MIIIMMIMFSRCLFVSMVCVFLAAYNENWIMLFSFVKRNENLPLNLHQEKTNRVSTIFWKIFKIMMMLSKNWTDLFRSLTVFLHFSFSKFNIDEIYLYECQLGFHYILFYFFCLKNENENLSIGLK